MIAAIIMCVCQRVLARLIKVSQYYAPIRLHSLQYILGYIYGSHVLGWMVYILEHTAINYALSCAY